MTDKHTPTPPGASLLERFFAKVEITPTCWTWKGAVKSESEPYGVLNVRGWSVCFAHRFSYELANGEIPADREIDHLCSNPRCVRPGHLEAVTHRVNVRRSRAPELLAARNRAVWRCPQGHLYDTQNTYIDAKKSRHCKTCMRIRSRERWRNQNARAALSQAEEAGK